MSESRLIFDPHRAGRRMRVAGFMSGSGTNLVKVLEGAGEDYEVVFIFTDRLDGRSRAPEIARRFGIPCFGYDIRRFYELRGLKRSVATPQGLEARREFDQVAARLIEAFDVDLVVLGGYMSMLTITGAVNVHPGDLSVSDSYGKRLLVGDDAVGEAIRRGFTELRSSTILTDMGVDTGPLLMVSEPLQVRLPMELKELLNRPDEFRRVVQEHQEQLKERGDWVILPMTLRLIAQGRMGLSPRGVVTLDGREYPQGVRPGDVE